MMKLMLGNEAVARGAWEAGVRVISSYPGTPSTEITEYAAACPDMLCEWAPNEKVAAEVAFGACMAGARAMTCMKHVGVNVAADPLFTAAYTGVHAGFVIVAADDPAMHSSQNEQDSRQYARAAHIPMLEPSDSEECRAFMPLAYSLSETYDTPVFVRLTTRVAHARSPVREGERTEAVVRDYIKDAAKYVMMPAMARERRQAVETRMMRLTSDAERLPVNRREIRDSKLGVITSGMSYQYVREALPEASVLKLGLVYPLPMALIRAFASQVDRLVVVEELGGFIQEQVAAAGIAVEGKQLTGSIGELSAARIRKAFKIGVTHEEETAWVTRPPVLCPGCPHRGAFYAIRKLNLNVMGDIGCYTLAALPPLSALDACLCMGASIGMAFGAEKAQGKAFSRHTVAVLGDSTFLHSGMTALLDAVYNGGTMTVVILDNRITGMTGHQDNPASGRDIYGREAPAADLEAIVKALGVSHVRTEDPFDLPSVIAALKEETARESVSVIIMKRPCALLPHQNRPPVVIAHCRNCGVCMALACPALVKTPEGVRADGNLCVGCGLCAGICPFGSIREGGENV
jgi:indolepyruvate ferredoxin oxidoreductase alpha subunit